jgi:hypothetical protein
MQRHPSDLASACRCPGCQLTIDEGHFRGVNYNATVEPWFQPEKLRVNTLTVACADAATDRTAYRIAGQIRPPSPHHSTF